MMHLCTVATLCFFEKNISRNYYYCDQDDNSLGLCFKSMYLTLTVAIVTSNFIFSMFKSSHTYRNINISNLTSLNSRCVAFPGPLDNAYLHLAIFLTSQLLSEQGVSEHTILQTLLTPKQYH